MNLAHGSKATVSTLASPNINDENDPDHPDRVAIKTTPVKIGGDGFALTFPRHSVTAVKVSAD